MLLADMGAELIRIVRPNPVSGPQIPDRFNLMNRSRPALTADLRTGKGRELVLRLCGDADALFEGFRPGVMERLGLGPGECRAQNPRLVYGRMTGWGQDGPLAGTAGHDTNYIALAGALHCMGERDRAPPLPLNLVGDFGGGALYLALGLLAALLEAQRSGQGQVVDASMTDGTASLLTMFHGLRAAGMWSDRRQANLLDGGAPFARCYATRDGGWIAVCALEPEFFANLLSKMQLTGIDPADQYRQDAWPGHARLLEAAFRSRSRDEWAELLSSGDTCATPVLSLDEAPEHPHNRARQTFVEVDGLRQPGPAPRFSRTSSSIRHGPRAPEADPRAVLAAWGLPAGDIEKLL
jgi:alpha-methylacyl-CoA racemase